MDLLLKTHKDGAGETAPQLGARDAQEQGPRFQFPESKWRLITIYNSISRGLLCSLLESMSMHTCVCTHHTLNTDTCRSANTRE